MKTYLILIIFFFFYNPLQAITLDDTVIRETQHKAKLDKKQKVPYRNNVGKEDPYYDGISTEEKEKYSTIDWFQTFPFKPVLRNVQYLSRALYFSSFMDFDIGFRINPSNDNSPEIYTAGLLYLTNVSSDGGSGSLTWADSANVLDLGLGIRYALFWERFFLGTGVGVGFSWFSHDKIIQAFYLDRVFFFQEIGVNLRRTVRSIGLVFVQVRVGTKIGSEIPAVLPNRYNLWNASVGFKWRYLL